MNKMSDKELDIILENDKEWRRHILKKISSIEDDQQDMLVTMTTLKVRFGLISGVFGTIAGTIAGFIADKIP